MGIQLGSNFTVNTALPLDDRVIVSDLTARDAILAGRRFEGLLVYVVSEETNFQLVGGILNTDWQELSGSGGATVATSGSKSLLNNSVNTITEIGEYLTEYASIIIDYYLYRRTDSDFKRLSGRIVLEGIPDGSTNPDKWQLLESIRLDNTDSGVIFSLDDVDTDKSVLVATLDDMSGTSHSCTLYYKLTKLSTTDGATGVLSLTNNSPNSISSIGDYLSTTKVTMVDYFIYRRTDSEYRTLSGKIILEGVPDGATNPDKWQLFEMERSENSGDIGITFTLDDIDTEKSILVATLDNNAGANHDCTIYFKQTKLA